MNKFKRVIALVLVWMLGASLCVSAEEEQAVNERGQGYRDVMSEELSYFDDIYRFDLAELEEENTGEESGEIKEVISNEKAVFSVLTLGIMERLEDGTFSENLTVSYPDFMEIAYKLAYGLQGSVAVDKDNLADSPVTVEEAAYYILSALGYVTEENQESFSVMSMADRLGLLQGQSLSAERYITRGQLAQMIYQSLQVDMMVQSVYGEQNQYEIVKGQTLLSGVFDVVELDGVLTAASGLDIYSSRRMNLNQVAVDRIQYEIGDEDYFALLGRRVFGYAQTYDDGSDPVVLGLMQHERDESVLISTDDISYVTNKEICYMVDGDEEKVSLDDVTNVLYNGTVAEQYQFDSSLTEHEGELLLGQSKPGDSYNLAVIYLRGSYRVRTVSVTEEKIYFMDGLEHNGQGYVDVKQSNDHYIKLQKNGKDISLSGISAGDVVSIVQSEDGTYTHITASNQKLPGVVSDISDNILTIDGEKYKISKNYFEASKLPGATAHSFAPGDTGTFCLSYEGAVVDFVMDEGVKYGYLTQMKGSSGLQPQLALRLFSQDNIWLEAEAAERLQLDGEFVSEADAITKLRAREAEVFYQPVRFQLNANGELKFLDTLYAGDAESGDTESLLFNFNWSAMTNYTNTYIFYSGGKSYSLFDAVMFIVPVDQTDEDDYSVRTSTAIPQDTQVSIDIYNADEVGHTPLIVYRGTDASGSDAFIANTVFSVEGVYQAVDEDGDTRIGVRGTRCNFIAPGQGNWSDLKLLVSKDLLEKEPDLTFKKGDIFMYVTDSKGEISMYQMFIRDGELADGMSTSLFQANRRVSYAYGKVNAVNLDATYKLVEIAVEQEGGATQELTFIPRGVQIYDSEKKDFTNTVMEELKVGDTIFVHGIECHVAATIFR